MEKFAVDVFPVNFSDKLTEAKYPERTFRYWACDKETRVFVLFSVAPNNKIYYHPKHMEEQYMFAIRGIGREAMHFKRKLFETKGIDFLKAGKSYRKDPEDPLRKNSDIRMGYKLRNEFLVKHYFTFGLREVDRNACHVIQTLNVPLVIYIRRRGGGGRTTKNSSLSPYFARPLSRGEERTFPLEQLRNYTYSILPPKTVSRIPPGTVYLMIAVQKTFFTIDIWPADRELPFERVHDPVNKVISKVPCLYYDRPVKTPHVDHVQEEEEEEEEDMEEEEENMEPQKNERQEFYEFFQSTPFPQQQAPSAATEVYPTATEVYPSAPTATEVYPSAPAATEVYPSAPAATQVYPSAPTTTNLIEGNTGQNLTLYFIPAANAPPPPPVPVIPEERKVVEISVEFAKNYQLLKSNEKWESGPCPLAVARIIDDELPLDLRVSPGDFLQQPTEEENLNNMEDQTCLTEPTEESTLNLEDLEGIITSTLEDIPQEQFEDIMKDLVNSPLPFSENV